MKQSVNRANAVASSATCFSENLPEQPEALHSFTAFRTSKLNNYEESQTILQMNLCLGISQFLTQKCITQRYFTAYYPRNTALRRLLGNVSSYKSMNAAYQSCKKQLAHRY